MSIEQYDPASDPRQGRVGIQTASASLKASTSRASGPLDGATGRIRELRARAGGLTEALNHHAERVFGAVPEAANGELSQVPGPLDGALPQLFEAIDGLEAALARLEAVAQRNMEIA